MNRNEGGVWGQAKALQTLWLTLSNDLRGLAEKQEQIKANIFEHIPITNESQMVAVRPCPNNFCLVRDEIRHVMHLELDPSACKEISYETRCLNVLCKCPSETQHEI